MLSVNGCYLPGPRSQGSSNKLENNKLAVLLLYQWPQTFESATKLIDIYDNSVIKQLTKSFAIYVISAVEVIYVT